MPRDDLPVLTFASRSEWEEWLREHHAAFDGLWIKIAKKATGIDTVTHAEALEVALCYGWIDGQRDRFDESWFLQRFTPRRARSRWSQVNRAKAIELIKSGSMRPAGLREVERAKADGRWDAAYEPVRSATVPEDLERELERNPAAREFFDTLNSQNRYAILYRLADAKRPETRARRLEQFVAMLNERRTIHP